MSSASHWKASVSTAALLALCLAAATALPAATASGPTASIAKKKCKKKGKNRALAAKKKCKKKHKEEVPAGIVATPTSHDFGIRAPSERNIPPFTFTLTNPGDTKVDGIFMTFGGYNGFVGDLTASCFPAIPPHGSCQFPVELLAPEEPGPFSGTITLDDHEGASVTLTLSGSVGG